MTTLQDWRDAAGDIVYTLFGAEGQLLFQEYAGLLLAAALALGGLLAALLLRRGLRLALAKWRGLVGDLPLLLSAEGRRALGLAREIRRGSRRVRRILLSSQEEAGENRALLQMLERFVRHELPEALVQTHSFIATGGARQAAELDQALLRQERAWAAKTDPAEREPLERQIAKTRQRLLQARQANTSKARLLKGLEEAALALRTLEVEMASLGAARSQALSDLRNQLNDMSEGLYHQRQVHEEFEEQA